MVWKEQEAKEKQVTQIATGACGATAVVNVLVSKNVDYFQLYSIHKFFIFLFNVVCGGQQEGSASVLYGGELDGPP